MMPKNGAYRPPKPIIAAQALYQASDDTLSEAPPMSYCDEWFINLGHIWMLFVSSPDDSLGFIKLEAIFRASTYYC
ncbi:hypothetical protein BI323_10155 [Yersinia ruckeri]|nr:hypothetical protein UGYR_06020 [Yersinia ruckeri]AUQ42274.1 hypothetical protein NJ56_10430 [Yersinia ruckeri]OEU23855.1 hypothetical protein BI323_10155 [Yersinia ruckeri]OJB83776.1 hypothetical protein A9Q62_04145 [Yersinia ruckeri]OJB90039.1 hypothetical protein A9Q60_04185 [Yersinia ruckeri]